MERKIIADESQIRLDTFIGDRDDLLSRSQVKKLINEKKVFVNSKIQKASYRLEINDVIEYSFEEEKDITLEKNKNDYQIVFEDDQIIVVNKPKNLTVHPSLTQRDNTLVNALLYDNKKLSNLGLPLRPGIVHRIDKDTTGLLVVAKTDNAYTNLQEQIKSKTANRKYLALVSGNIKEDKLKIENYICIDKKDRRKMAVSTKLNKGKIATTECKVLERFGKYTLCEFILQTGRTHQIRVHSHYIKHPIVGDEKYNGDLSFKVDGQLLHSYELSLNNPKTNIRQTFNAKLPDDFVKVLKKLNSNEVKNYE